MASSDLADIQNVPRGSSNRYLLLPYRVSFLHIRVYPYSCTADCNSSPLGMSRSPSGDRGCDSLTTAANVFATEVCYVPFSPGRKAMECLLH